MPKFNESPERFPPQDMELALATKEEENARLSEELVKWYLPAPTWALAFRIASLRAVPSVASPPPPPPPPH